MYVWNVEIHNLSVWYCVLNRRLLSQHLMFSQHLVLNQHPLLINMHFFRMLHFFVHYAHCFNKLQCNLNYPNWLMQKFVQLNEVRIFKVRLFKVALWFFLSSFHCLGVNNTCWFVFCYFSWNFMQLNTFWYFPAKCGSVPAICF